ncbi:MAG: hypothetical protein AAGC67_15005 [Myxococcota bacterium]
MVLVSWVLGSTLAFAEDDRLSAYHGEWQRIADDAADDARLSSIDLATGDLSWLVRKMATGVLEKTTMPPGELAFFEEADGLRQHVRGPNGEFERPVAVDAGPTQHTDPGGEETTIEWKRTAEGLEAHWAQSRAYGRNLYRLDEGGQTLHVEHHIQVTAIEGIDEIVYGSRFGRTAVPPVSSGPPAEDVSGRELDLR